jgi:opacity protein-like surface antigen
MRKLLATATAIVAFASIASAQIPTSGNIFVGYSYYNSQLTVDRENLNGWEGSLEGKVLPFLGIVADFSGHYGTSSTLNGFCINENFCGPVSVSHQLAVMFGPRASASLGRWTPFGQVLVGLARTSASTFGTNTSFASAFGGGLDCRIVKPVAWRFQADYVRTGLYSLTQNNFRFSTGIVFRF